MAEHACSGLRLLIELHASCICTLSLFKVGISRCDLCACSTHSPSSQLMLELQRCVATGLVLLQLQARMVSGKVFSHMHVLRGNALPQQVYAVVLAVPCAVNVM